MLDGLMGKMGVESIELDSPEKQECYACHLQQPVHMTKSVLNTKTKEIEKVNVCKECFEQDIQTVGRGFQGCGPSILLLGLHPHRWS